MKRARDHPLCIYERPNPTGFVAPCSPPFAPRIPSCFCWFPQLAPEKTLYINMEFDPKTRKLGSPFSCPQRADSGSPVSDLGRFELCLGLGQRPMARHYREHITSGQAALLLTCTDWCH